MLAMSSFNLWLPAMFSQRGWRYSALTQSILHQHKTSSLKIQRCSQKMKGDMSWSQPVSKLWQTSQIFTFQQFHQSNKLNTMTEALDMLRNYWVSGYSTWSTQITVHEGDGDRVLRCWWYHFHSLNIQAEKITANKCSTCSIATSKRISLFGVISSTPLVWQVET